MQISKTPTRLQDIYRGSNDLKQSKHPTRNPKLKTDKTQKESQTSSSAFSQANQAVLHIQPLSRGTSIQEGTPFKLEFTNEHQRSNPFSPVKDITPKKLERPKTASKQMGNGAS